MSRSTQSSETLYGQNWFVIVYDSCGRSKFAMFQSSFVFKGFFKRYTRHSRSNWPNRFDWWSESYGYWDPYNSSRRQFFLWKFFLETILTRGIIILEFLFLVKRFREELSQVRIIRNPAMVHCANPFCWFIFYWYSSKTTRCFREFSIFLITILLRSSFWTIFAFLAYT